MQGIKNLTCGPINRRPFNLAMPIMATSFIQMTYNLTDTAWMRRLGSEAAVTIGSVGILMWMSDSISLLNKVGSEVNVGQSVDAQNQEDARQFASHNITIALIILICWGRLLFMFANPIIRIYELEEHITANAIEYLRIISIALPFIFLPTTFTGIYNAAGRGKIPFCISGTRLIMNIILDPLFTFGFGLGTDDAAYTTWLSQATVFAIFIYQLRSRKDALLGGFPFFSRLKKKCTRHILKLGLSVATLNTLFVFINMLLCRAASGQDGHIGLMTFTTDGQIEAITWNTPQGFFTVLSTFITQNFATGRIGRVLKVWHTTLWMTGIFGTFCTLLFVFYGNEVFSIFVPEQTAYRAGGVFLRIDGYSQLFMMLEIIMQGVFYGIGRTVPPAIVSIVCSYMRIPLVIPFVWIGIGVEDIWWTVYVITIAKGLILLGWFTMIRKKCLNLPSMSTR